MMRVSIRLIVVLGLLAGCTPLAEPDFVGMPEPIILEEPAIELKGNDCLTGNVTDGDGIGGTGCHLE